MEKPEEAYLYRSLERLEEKKLKAMLPIQTDITDFTGDE